MKSKILFCRLLPFVLIFGLSLAKQAPKKRDYHPFLVFGKPNNPGIEFRFTQKGFSGIDYVRDVTERLMREQVPTLQIDEIYSELDGHGEVTISDMRITRYRVLTKSVATLSEPNQIKWNMSNMDITTTECKATVNKLDVSLTQGGLLERVIELVKDVVISRTRPLVEHEMCLIATHWIDSQMGERIEGFPVRIPLSSVKQIALGNPDSLDADARNINRNLSSFAAGSEITNESIERLYESFWIDYSLLNQPIVKNGEYLQFQGRGEISPTGSGQTPFYPSTITHPHYKKNAKMMYIYISDFVINSALYHSYRTGTLNISVGPRSKQFGRFLHTTCSRGGFTFCLGDMIPELGEAFPNHDIQVTSIPSRAPALVFTDAHGGQVIFFYNSILQFQLAPENGTDYVKAFSVSMNMSGQAQIGVTKDHRLIGRLNVRLFELKVIDSETSNLVPGQRLYDAEEWTSLFLIETINELLASGIPLPIIQGVKLASADLLVQRRAIQLASDFIIDERMLNKAARTVLNPAQRNDLYVFDVEGSNVRLRVKDEN